METDGPVRKELLCRFYESGFCEVCGKYGGNWFRITKAEELVPTLEKAFEQNVPVIIDCPVDYAENTKLTAHLKELMEKL